VSLSELAPLLAATPSTAITAYLAWMVHRLMGNASTDRGDYRADMDAAEARHSGELQRLRDAYAAEIDRLRASYEADLAAVRASLAEMRTQLTEMTVQLDAERRARWHAEDVAAEARRTAAAAAAAVAPADPLGGE
jgi:chromosome segregation ATPase